MSELARTAAYKRYDDLLMRAAEDAKDDIVEFMRALIDHAAAILGTCPSAAIRSAMLKRFAAGLDEGLKKHGLRCELVPTVVEVITDDTKTT